MKHIRSFSLFEGVRSSDDGYAFDFHSDNDGEIMSLKFLDRRSVKMTAGDTTYRYYYCYEFEHGLDRTLLKKLKMFDDTIKPHDMDLLVSKGVQGLDHRHRLNTFDCIVYPKSSSLLLKEFSKSCEVKSGVAELVPDAFVKSSVADVKFDTDAIERIGNASTRKQIYKAIDHIKSGESIAMKEIYPPYRKFVKDFIKFDKADDRHVFNLVHDKKVLLIDDYRTTGSTLKEMMGQLLKFSPREVVICIVIRVIDGRK